MRTASLKNSILLPQGTAWKDLWGSVQEQALFKLKILQWLSERHTINALLYIFLICLCWTQRRNFRQKYSDTSEIRHNSFKRLHFFLLLQPKEKINWYWYETPPKAKGSFDLRLDTFLERCLKLLLWSIFTTLVQKWRINESQLFFTWISLLMTLPPCPAASCFSIFLSWPPTKNHCPLINSSYQC